MRTPHRRREWLGSSAAGSSDPGSLHSAGCRFESCTAHPGPHGQSDLAQPCGSCVSGMPGKRTPWRYRWHYLPSPTLATKRRSSLTTPCTGPGEGLGRNYRVVFIPDCLAQSLTIELSTEESTMHTTGT
jgi:hypothetical protein